MRGWPALAMAPLAALLAIGPVLAQDEENVPASSRIVPPAECVTDPMAVDALSAILALDGDGIAAPGGIRLTPPRGEIVDRPLAISIKEAAREVIACFNAGDLHRGAALMTENGVARAYWGLTFDQVARDDTRVRLAAEPEPRSPETLIRLIAVTDATMMPDGRIAAYVVINEPLLPPNGPETLLFLFRNEDDRWLVDDWVDFTIVPVVPPEDAMPSS